MNNNSFIQVLKRIINDEHIRNLSTLRKCRNFIITVFLVTFFVACALIYSIFFNNIDTTQISFVELSNKKKEKYQIEYSTQHINFEFCRDIEYVGGFSKPVKDIRLENIDEYYSLNEEKKFVTLYLDKNTKEILKGNLNDDFIMAGTTKAGINRIIVPDERKTKKGFQDYILKWTGGIVFNDYDGVFSKNYGMEYNNYIYNMPVDYIVDANWNKNVEYTKKDVINISTISDVKCNTYNYLGGKLSNKEYILNILRNCFGFIGDNFYDLVNNRNYFYQILDDKRIEESAYIPTKIRLGDIGIHLSNGKEYIGICVGYTNKQKPVFSICIDLDCIGNYLSKKINIQNLKKIKGFNLLYVDEGKSFFNYYYKTNLPFTDKENSDYYNNKDLLIKDINIFNNQILRTSDFDASNIVYLERMERIKLRENEATKIRNEQLIDLNKYFSMNIEDIDSIYDLNTEKYYKFIFGEEHNVGINSNKSKKTIKEIYDEHVQKDKEYLVGKLNQYYGDIKNMSLNEIIIFLKGKGITLTDLGNNILREYYDDVINRK